MQSFFPHSGIQAHGVAITMNIAEQRGAGERVLQRSAPEAHPPLPLHSSLARVRCMTPVTTKRQECSPTVHSETEQTRSIWQIIWITTSLHPTDGLILLSFCFFGFLSIISLWTMYLVSTGTINFSNTIDLKAPYLLRIVFGFK